MYIVDSDDFITAKNRYYAFGICPGFWDRVIDHLLTSARQPMDEVIRLDA